jgi:serine/threonine-protein kinase
MKQFGRYEVLENIGSGAMGAVFKARDPMMDRVVAVKTIHASALIGPLAEQYRERFTREARAAGRLAHAGLVTVFDAGVEGETPYLVMEFVPGRTLEAVLNSGEQYGLDRVYEIGQQLAEALGYAHSNGVVHRDIKPANILLTGAPERAKIADFGVAKLLAAQVTSTGTLLGTPAFMAPEQFTGTPVDGRSDLFSLGVILYWMATGDKPFTGDTITAVSYKIVHTEPVAPRQLNPSVPEALERVIVKCLAKDPATRYQTGEELAADLGALRAGRRPAVADSGIGVAGPVPGAVSATLSSQATVNTQRPAATGGVARTAAPAAPPTAPQTELRPPAPPSPSRLISPPEPQGSNWKVGLYIVAALVVVGLLWGATVMKQRKEQEAAAVAASKAQSANSATSTQPAASFAVPAETNPAVPPPPSVKETKQAPVNEAKSQEPRKRTPTTPPAQVEVPAQAVDLSGYALRLEISSIAPTNVEIQADGNPPQAHYMRAGQTVSAGAAKVFQVRTDNAGGMHLRLNGQEIPDLGPMGSPRTARLSARNLAGATSPSGNTQQSAPATERRQSAAKAQVDLEITNLPNFAEVSVWVDDKPIFERPGVMQSGADSVSKIEAIASGSHTIAVWIGNRKAQKGVRKEVSGQFTPGQTRILRAHTHFDGHRGPGMFTFDLALE